jgi:alcohol dehydrogenase class IV
MDPFVYTASPARVIFGSGTKVLLADEVRRLSCRRALVLSTPQQRKEANMLAADLGSLAVGAFTDAVMHTPVEVTEAVVAFAKELGSDCVVAVGGGSATGLGKAIAFNTGLPQIVLPTTYAGSEATSILGQTAGGKKTTIRSPKVQPEVIIYDTDFTLTLPAHQSVVSGLNAIAHAVEALYATDGNPVTSMLAEEGVRRLAESLPKLGAFPYDRGARSDALYAAWLCGCCLNAVSMGLHHQLCHVLGGMFKLPHAETHAVILPHAVAYNALGAPDAMRRVALALGSEDASAALFDLASRLGAPMSLAALGLKQENLEDAAIAATERPYPNPRPISLPSIRTLLKAAFDGTRPSVGGGEEAQYASL